uniref:Uncharacterized protein n=1 Tax=Nelumbo nucifera TaxID=4432 RepID=A0A822YK43_NELNU|nr:TPA_asm: hypothetical protein HUJ06_011334 [Nelumbo nucifera]
MLNDGRDLPSRSAEVEIHPPYNLRSAIHLLQTKKPDRAFDDSKECPYKWCKPDGNGRH